MPTGWTEALLLRWRWLVKRGLNFFMTLVFTVTHVSQQMRSGPRNHRDGIGWFSDPLGKPSVLAHWRHLAEFSYGSLTMTPKTTAEEGLAAAGELNGDGAVDTTAAAAALEWDRDGVTVTDTGRYLEFLPPAEKACPADGDAATAGQPQPQPQPQPLVGVIIFPGALILPNAYAPLARTMAQKGYPSYVLRFEFNLANSGWETAGDIVSPSTPSTGTDGDIDANGDSVDGNCPTRSTTPANWVLVGHSMGAIGIEMFYPGHAERVHGVVYMGAGSMIGDAMAGADVPMMVLRGSRDPFVPAEALEKSAPKLPKGTETVVVEGGSHRGFASYTRQPLDWEATITPQEQRRIVVEALTDFIERRVLAG